MNVLHPPFVHFVIALPLAALFSQLTYLKTADRTYSKAAIRIMVLASLVSFFAIFSGLIDAGKIIQNQNILKSGLPLLDHHKVFGFVVVFILLITTLTKWLALSKNSLTLEKLSLSLIILSISVSLYQGNKGGSIVYKYSGGVDTQIIMNRVSENNTK
ncbi:DUF2231 domain-containing protein [Sulfurovum sp. ST-21]|uniref:DUF2231 domain-containing protein n=1 Tax=Sulfurovum indicum TaxID=2779528 RepID=A0A7M1S106_9BACT|nr:DUF2231 domain-containing protein [Sulfurovum indicum]QOR61056.1 DUF2231 domain-containing protein [Sulfurovum indicum]